MDNCERLAMATLRATLRATLAPVAATMRHDQHARRRRRRRYATGERATVLLPPTRTANTGNGGRDLSGDMVDAYGRPLAGRSGNAIRCGRAAYGRPLAATRLGCTPTGEGGDGGP